MDLDTTVFVCDDPDVIAGYVAHCELASEIINGCVAEAKEKWKRLPVSLTGRAQHVVVGLAVREHDWTWEAAFARHKAKLAENGESFFGFNADRAEPVVIPDGWRRRVKDDYLSPPLRGSSPAIKEAQEFCKRWSHESARGYLERVHGAPHIHFAGLRLITIGADVKEDKLWIVSGKGYEVKDERFKPVPLSEYIAMRERNPSPEKDDEDE